eukprot:765441-Hanusia_phi.AAC.5
MSFPLPLAMEKPKKQTEIKLNIQIGDSPLHPSPMAGSELNKTMHDHKKYARTAKITRSTTLPTSTKNPTWEGGSDLPPAPFVPDALGSMCYCCFNCEVSASLCVIEPALGVFILSCKLEALPPSRCPSRHCSLRLFGKRLKSC